MSDLCNNNNYATSLWVPVSTVLVVLDGHFHVQLLAIHCLADVDDDRYPNMHI